MSTQPAIPLSAASLATDPGRARGRIAIAGLSINGVLLFATSLLVFGSGTVSMRAEIGGLLLHPYLIPVALALPYVLIARLGDFPARIAAGLLAFLGIYVFSILSGGSLQIGEVSKVVSGLITIFVCALLVRRRGDFVAGTSGLSIAIALLAVRGLVESKSAELDVMDAANKNAYSLFALPAILMAGFICVRMPSVPVMFKWLLIACTLPALAVIFMSGNRSGYLGAVLIGAMLFWDRRGKGLILVGVAAAAVIFWLTQFGTTEVFDRRMQQTMQGDTADKERRDITLACLQIGLENPLIGVSPQQVPFEIGRRLSVRYSLGYLDSHNVFAHLFAGSGLLCILALAFVGWVLWSWKPRDGIKVGGKDDPLRDARHLLRMMLFLWVVRGMFTREILYNPSFSIGLGLCIGMCMLAEVARQSTLTGRPNPLSILPRNNSPPPQGLPQQAH